MNKERPETVKYVHKTKDQMYLTIKINCIEKLNILVRVNYL
jgi:hypothetical protein